MPCYRLSTSITAYGNGHNGFASRSSLFARLRYSLGFRSMSLMTVQLSLRPFNGDHFTFPLFSATLPCDRRLPTRPALPQIARPPSGRHITPQPPHARTRFPPNCPPIRQTRHARIAATPIPSCVCAQFPSHRGVAGLCTLQLLKFHFNSRLENAARTLHNRSRSAKVQPSA